MCLDYIMKFFFTAIVLIIEGVIQGLEGKQSKVYAIRYIFWLSADGSVCKEWGCFFKKCSSLSKQIFAISSLHPLLNAPVIFRDHVANNYIRIYLEILLICYEWKIMDQSLYVNLIKNWLPNNICTMNSMKNE